jgi:hypothetical protein
MNRILSGTGLALLALTTLSMSIGPAHAIVYCRAVGVPQGCVVRPVAPVARAVARNNVGAPGLGGGERLRRRVRAPARLLN